MFNNNCFTWNMIILCQARWMLMKPGPVSVKVTRFQRVALSPRYSKILIHTLTHSKKNPKSLPCCDCLNWNKKENKSFIREITILFKNLFFINHQVNFAVRNNGVCTPLSLLLSRSWFISNDAYTAGITASQYNDVSKEKIHGENENKSKWREIGF